MTKDKFDWRAKLDTDNSLRFNALVAQVSKYEHVYKDSPDPQKIQMWLGILEICKRQDAILKRLDTLEKKLFVRDEKKREGILGDLDNY